MMVEMKDYETCSMLDAIRDLVEAEKGLTEAMQNAMPLLDSRNGDESVFSNVTTPLPTPKDLSSATEVLALARSLSSRSSLPPFPAQLRGGSLGIMQRKMTKLERLRKDKQRLKEKEQKQQKQKQEEMELQKREEEEKQEKQKQIQELGIGKRKVGLLDTGAGARRQRVEKTFMNLSDSSSEEDTDDESDDSE